MAELLALDTLTGPDAREVTRKMAALRALLREMESVVVGFSGGIDSTLVAAVAHEVLGDRALAVIARSESYPKAELELACGIADQGGWRYRVIDTSELGNPDYSRNDASRCYFCKSELFTHLRQIADAEDYAWIAYGANQDDMADFRPGHRAARESEVRSPLYEVGMTKAEIREAARQIGLPNWNKPAMACLSSRVPYGTAVTAEVLAKIEAAEDTLRQLGFEQFRVRHHDAVARLEIPRDAWPQLLQDDMLDRVTAGIKAAGYTFVALDLQGFRSGSMNALLKREA